MQTLSDAAAEAHNLIQEAFDDINPVIGINQSMRKANIPADIMTIDCLVTNKRIIILLHDDLPKAVRYQFSFRDQDPGDNFNEVAVQSVTVETIYEWIKAYFSTAKLN